MNLFLMKPFNIEAKFNSGGREPWLDATHKTRDAGNSETQVTNVGAITCREDETRQDGS